MNISKYFSSFASLLPRNIGDTLSNLIEIIIIAYIVYIILLWIKSTKAWQLLKGIFIILTFTLLASIFHFDAIIWLLGKVATIAVTTLIIIFQPELRRALEQLGRKNLLLNIFKKDASLLYEDKIEEIVKASFDLSYTKTGALIVIERNESLQEFISTGIRIDAIINSELLVNIFEHNTPLHDGAVIIRGDRIEAATCYLPLSENTSISKSFGTRHRAALGISEVSDSITVVVSEETAKVSLAYQGRIIRVLDYVELKNKLINLLGSKNSNNKFYKFNIWNKRKENEE